MFAKIAKTPILGRTSSFLTFPRKLKKMTHFLMRNQKLVLVLKSDSHSKNATVGSLCNQCPVQLQWWWAATSITCINSSRDFAVKFTTTPMAANHVQSSSNKKMLQTANELAWGNTKYFFSQEADLTKVKYENGRRNQSLHVLLS